MKSVFASLLIVFALALAGFILLPAACWTLLAVVWCDSAQQFFQLSELQFGLLLAAHGSGAHLLAVPGRIMCKHVGASKVHMLCCLAGLGVQ